jgi:hypothetical protein
MFLGRLAQAIGARRPVTVPPEPCDPGAAAAR